MGLVGVRAGVDEPVTVRWSAAEVAALVSGLGAHRRGGSEPGAEDFPAGLVAEQHDQCLVCRVVVVQRSADLGQPQLDAMAAQGRQQMVELAGRECPFILAHDDRVEPTVRVSERGQ
jgi:hypothetical protein